MKFIFGDIVVVRGEDIGVVIKCWITSIKERENNGDEMKYEVYVRNDNRIEDFYESEIERYMVQNKELSKEEKVYQYNAINNL